MDPKKVITLFVVLAIVALSIGFGTMWFQSQKEPDGRFNFSGTTADYYTNDSGLPISASSNKQFYIADITLKNDNYNPGLDTVKLIWKVTIDKGTYSLDLEQLLLPSFMPENFIQMVFEKGKMWNYTVVFTIPKVIALEDISMSYTYLTTDDDPSLKYDENLHLPDPRNTTSDIYDPQECWIAPSVSFRHGSKAL